MIDDGKLVLDVVLFKGETAQDVAARMAEGFQGVTWSISDSGNGWPEITFRGDKEILGRIQRRYSNIGKNSGNLKGRPPVRKGEIR